MVGGKREALMRAMVRVVADRGYDNTDVAEVCRRAGLTDVAFRHEFRSLDECLFATHDALAEAAIGRVEEAYRGADGEWPVKLRGGLRALLAGLAGDPAGARLALIEVPSAGGPGRARARAVADRLRGFLREGRDYAALGPTLPGDVELMAIAGAEAIITEEVLAGRTGELPGIIDELVFVLLSPYLGPEAALHESRRLVDS